MLGTLGPGQQVGAIIGIVLAALILCCCCLFCLWLRKDKQAAAGLKRLTLYRNPTIGGTPLVGVATWTSAATGAETSSRAVSGAVDAHHIELDIASLDRHSRRPAPPMPLESASSEAFEIQPIKQDVLSTDSVRFSHGLRAASDDEMYYSARESDIGLESESLEEMGELSEDEGPHDEDDENAFGVSEVRHPSRLKRARKANKAKLSVAGAGD